MKYISDCYYAKYRRIFQFVAILRVYAPPAELANFYPKFLSIKNHQRYLMRYVTESQCLVYKINRTVLIHRFQGELQKICYLYAYSAYLCDEYLTSADS